MRTVPIHLPNCGRPMKPALCVILVLCFGTAATAQPLVKKNQSENGYAVKLTAVRAPVWSDKAYAITLVPPALRGSQMLVRPAGVGRDWPESRDYTVTTDCTAYLAIRSEYNGENHLPEEKAKKLTEAGWTEVNETFRVNPGGNENWKWRIFKKDIPAGKLELKIDGLKFDAMTVFLFGKKRA